MRTENLNKTIFINGIGEVSVPRYIEPQVEIITDESVLEEITIAEPIEPIIDIVMPKLEELTEPAEPIIVATDEFPEIVEPIVIEPTIIFDEPEVSDIIQPDAESIIGKQTKGRKGK